MVMKLKKRKKSKGQRGNTTYGHGSRKKWRSSGEQGGRGMSGTGKRADHKKSLVIKLYGNKYFGKQGITSKGTRRRKEKIFNLEQIEKNFEYLIEKYGKGSELDLSKYKILGDGELTKKLTIKARAFTANAKEKIEKAGGKTVLAKIKTEKISKEKVVKEDNIKSETKGPKKEKKNKKINLINKKIKE
jgi:large subunit ribosomal protein L15